jgi:hypothetical protein
MGLDWTHGITLLIGFGLGFAAAAWLILTATKGKE